MFESLTEQLQGVFRNLGRRGKLRESDVDEALREIRLALLEADVHYQVVKDLLARVRERAVGAEVSRALNPAQQVVKILNEELIRALGEPTRLNLTGPTPRVLMFVGLQGSGKTTTAAKLAKWFSSRKLPKSKLIYQGLSRRSPRNSLAASMAAAASWQ